MYLLEISPKKYLFPRSSRANSSHQFLVQKVALDVGNDPFDRCTMYDNGSTADG